ncbi:hypothetical protein ATDW_37040 (plasmid) [Asticcacaulis sp. DW145]|uniref:hypothetical protein n=1 Tax=Asticcacaulis sp. DW145 TaxID=3095608 RepID=UPI00308FF778|nr:hypothetical protein ATDW_37040 [Asticcacaulis sp. DW145]
MFAATARCSHLHHIDTSLVTPESEMTRALIRQYVDDVSDNFAIDTGGKRFKDFVDNYFTGTVAAGLAYLAMVQENYVWFSHFERLKGGRPRYRKSPDFVFLDKDFSCALVESKGSRLATSTAFNARVEAGYLDQVHPHIGYPIGGIIATHGYCVGSYLSSSTQADLRIHFTHVPFRRRFKPQTKQGKDEIQRNNYVTAFALVHSETLGEQIRTGDGPDSIGFMRFEWRGQYWLTALEDQRQRQTDLGSGFVYAMEQGIALRVLTKFLSHDLNGEQIEIEPLPPERFQRLKEEIGRPEGAVFPDGLAVIAKPEFRDPVRLTRGPTPDGHFGYRVTSNRDGLPTLRPTA